MSVWDKGWQPVQNTIDNTEIVHAKDKSLTSCNLGTRSPSCHCFNGIFGLRCATTAPGKRQPSRLCSCRVQRVSTLATPYAAKTMTSQHPATSDDLIPVHQEERWEGFKFEDVNECVVLIPKLVNICNEKSQPIIVSWYCVVGIVLLLLCGCYYHCCCYCCWCCCYCVALFSFCFLFLLFVLFLAHWDGTQENGSSECAKYPIIVEGGASQSDDRSKNTAVKSLHWMHDVHHAFEATCINLARSCAWWEGSAHAQQGAGSQSPGRCIVKGSAVADHKMRESATVVVANDFRTKVKRWRGHQPAPRWWRNLPSKMKPPTSSTTIQTDPLGSRWKAEVRSFRSALQAQCVMDTL